MFIDKFDELDDNLFTTEINDWELFILFCLMYQLVINTKFKSILKVDCFYCFGLILARFSINLKLVILWRF